MKKRQHILFIFILLLQLIFIVIPICLYLAGKLYSSPKKIYEINWNLSLPDDLKLQADYKNTEGFHNDGNRHSIFYMSENKEFISDFNQDQNSGIEELCQNIMSLLNEAEADFSQPYLWCKYQKYGNVLVIIYFPSCQQLHLFQDFK